MGNFIGKDDIQIEMLKQRIESLERENAKLREGKSPVIRLASIEKYVDGLLAKKETNISLIPDVVERRIYRNTLLFAVELMENIFENFELKILGQVIKVEINNDTRIDRSNEPAVMNL